MDDHLWGCLRHCRLYVLTSPHVAPHILNLPRQAKGLIQRWPCWHADAVSGYLRPQQKQPLRQPGTLEPCEPRDEDAPVGLVAVEQLIHSRLRHFQTFQGACPSDHSVSSKFLSRRVSMGCQKPSCTYACLLY